MVSMVFGQKELQHTEVIWSNEIFSVQLTATTSVYVWQSFCKFSNFDMQKLAPQKQNEKKCTI